MLPKGGRLRPFGGRFHVILRIGFRSVSKVSAKFSQISEISMKLRPSGSTFQAILVNRLRKCFWSVSENWAAACPAFSFFECQRPNRGMSSPTILKQQLNDDEISVGQTKCTKFSWCRRLSAFHDGKRPNRGLLFGGPSTPIWVGQINVDEITIGQSKGTEFSFSDVCHYF